MGGIQDPAANHKPLAALRSVTIATATTTDGIAIDTFGWRWATWVINVGTVAGTTTGVSAIITSDPASGGSYATTVGTFNAVNLLAGADTDIGRVDCLKTERYLRVEVTTVGASPSVPIGVTVTLSNAKDSADQTATYAFTV